MIISFVGASADNVSATNKFVQEQIRSMDFGKTPRVIKDFLYNLHVRPDSTMGRTSVIYWCADYGEQDLAAFKEMVQEFASSASSANLYHSETTPWRLLVLVPPREETMHWIYPTAIVMH